MMIGIFLSSLLAIFSSRQAATDSVPYLLVLGITQDGGYPHAGCQRTDCQRLFKKKQKGDWVSCIAVVDPTSKKSWMIDATPDFAEQLEVLEKTTQTTLAGIFLTHAHVGHYTGLMHLGREVMGARQVPVYAMPRMQLFLEQNGPWSQLITLQNIAIQPLADGTPVALTNELSITPFLVPHRDEFSETVGFQIETSKRKALFIPDINKWDSWNRAIVAEVQKVDIALLDGSFYKNGEIPGRDMSEIPHPFVEETMRLFQKLPASEKAKVHFIHLNHTNPLLQKNNPARRALKKAGFRIAERGQCFEL